MDTSLPDVDQDVDGSEGSEPTAPDATPPLERSAAAVPTSCPQYPVDGAQWRTGLA